MADHVVYRGADRAGKPLVVQRSGDGILLHSNVLVTDFVEFNGPDAGLNMRPDHAQHIGGQLAGDTHQLDLVPGF